MVLVSLLAGGHPAAMSVALGSLVSGLGGGWILFLGILANRDLAGRLAHASFIFSASTVPFALAVLAGSWDLKFFLID